MENASVDKDEIYLNVMRALKQVDYGRGATQVEIRSFMMGNGLNPDPDLNEMELGNYIREALKRGIQFKVLYRTNTDGKYHITDNPPCPLPVLVDDDEGGPPRAKKTCLPKPPRCYSPPQSKPKKKM